MNRFIFIILLFFSTMLFAQDRDYIVKKGNDTTFCKIKRISKNNIFFIHKGERKLYNELSDVLGYKKGDEEFVIVQASDESISTSISKNAVFGALNNDTIQQYQKTAKNAVYLEFLGAGILHSVNYERLIKESKKIKLYGRLGFTPVYLDGVVQIPDEGINQGPTKTLGERFEPMFPFGISIIYKGKKKGKRAFWEQGIYFSWIAHNIEKKAGKTYLNNGLWASVHLLGYRTYIKRSKFFVRFAIGLLAPVLEVYRNDVYVNYRDVGAWDKDLLEYSKKFIYYPLLGISFGYGR